MDTHSTIPLPLILALTLAAMSAIAAGLWLLIFPDRSRALTSKQSLYHWFRWGKRPYRVERYIYRHHRIFGSSVTLGALFILYWLWSGGRRSLFQLTFNDQGRFATDLLLAVQSTAIILTVSALFALAIGILIFIRPSILRGFEEWANQPVSLRATISWIRNAPARWATGHPRLTAAILLAAGLYLLLLIIYPASLALR
jgi:hypothetical protein